MSKLLFGFILLCSMMISNFAQTPVTEANYRIYDSRGAAATLPEIIAAIGKTKVVFLGENHDDSVAHHLQAEIFRRVLADYGKQAKVALSLEMFERDVQIVADEYLRGLITENHFLLSSRPWNNYKTDYRPLIELAKTNNLAVIAANAPRRYVNMVSRGGREALEQLSSQAKAWLAPLPFEPPSKGYAAKFNALMGGAPEASMGLNKILDAQSLWDATMAFSIAEYLKKEKNALVIHLNGGFHSENRLGAPEHLRKYVPGVKFLVVTIKTEESFTNFDKTKFEDAGDFIILTDARVPRSFK